MATPGRLLDQLSGDDTGAQFYGLELLRPTRLGRGHPLYPNLKRMAHAGWLTSRPEDERSWLAGAPPGRGPGRRRAALHELKHHKPCNRKKGKTDENHDAHNRRKS